MFQKFEYKNLVAACIRRAASLHQIEMMELNVQPEHIHCIVSFDFSFSASKVLQLLKGISARLFFQYHERARLRYPRGHLWSKRKFASSVGFVHFETVRNYVRNQDIHHSGNRTLQCAEDVILFCNRSCYLAFFLGNIGIYSWTGFSKNNGSKIYSHDYGCVDYFHNLRLFYRKKK